MTMKIIKIILLLLPSIAYSLEPLSSDDLGNVAGQGGVYLTGDLTINDSGGPLNVDGPARNNYNWQLNCDSSDDSRCGGRIAVNTGGNGWLVLDNIRGRFSFEGLTLRTRVLSTATDAGSFGTSDVETFLADGGSNVLEFGLPNELRFTDTSFTVANSNSARPTDDNYQQTDIFSVNINGISRLQGNALLFPTGSP
jgi:hypothetical protein